MRYVDATAEAARRELGRELAGASVEIDSKRESQVRVIIGRVRAGGDAAVIDFSEKFDGWRPKSPASLEIAAEYLHAALDDIEPELRKALDTAASRIRAYARRQALDSWSGNDGSGMRLGQRVRALDRVGIYAPGGTAAYPSSVLMAAIPAKVAGVDEIILATPAKNGKVNQVILAAAALAGVNRVFKIGGAQAIAAMAWGTESVPAVDKIVGPGNPWVAEAKRQVFGQVGIDMVAGPSEIAIIADATARAEWLAADLLAQAEHDAEARAILLSDSAKLLSDTRKEIKRQLQDLERAEIARESIESSGMLVHVRNLGHAASLVNKLAPEHLQIIVAEPDALLKRIRHAGAIFIGEYTAEVFSDYCAGPNHILPTLRCARYASPLGTYDFQKRSTVLRADAKSIQSILAPTVALAKAEGLTAHAQAAELRSQNEE